MPHPKRPAATARPGAILAVLGAAAVLGAVLAAAALAGKGGSIQPVPRSDKGAEELVRSVVEGNQQALVRAKFVTVPPGHDPVAVSTRRIDGFPTNGDSFAILSTGCARLALRPDNRNDTGCRDAGVKTRGARDVTILRIRVQVPKGDNCLSFRFRFLSEEYPEFVGSRYNDAFIAELDHSPRWTASDNRDPTVEAPDSFATTRRGKDIITVNATGVAKVSKAAARGTTYDAATGKLRASTPVSPGRHLLYLSLFDQGDRQYDSAVFLDQLGVRHAKHCRSGLAK